MDPTQPHQHLFTPTEPILQSGALPGNTLVAGPQFMNLDEAWMLLAPPHHLAEAAEALGRALPGGRRRGARQYSGASSGSRGVIRAFEQSALTPSSRGPGRMSDPIPMDFAADLPSRSNVRKRHRDESEREMQAPTAGKQSDLGAHAGRLRSALPIQQSSDQIIFEALSNLPGASAAFSKFDPCNVIAFDGIKPHFGINGSVPEPQYVLSPGGRFLPGVAALRAALAAWRGEAGLVPSIAGPAKVAELATLLESRCVTELQQLEAALDATEADASAEQIQEIIRDADRVLQSLGQARALSRGLENHWRGLAGAAGTGTFSSSQTSSSESTRSESTSSFISSISVSEPVSEEAWNAARNVTKQAVLGRTLDSIVPGLEFEIHALRLRYPPSAGPVDVGAADQFDAEADVMMEDEAPEEAEQAGGIIRRRHAERPPGPVANLPFFPWALEQRLLRQDRLPDRDSKSSGPRVEANIIKLLTTAREANKAKSIALAEFDRCKRDLQPAKRKTRKKLQREDNLDACVAAVARARTELDVARANSLQACAHLREIPCFATNNYPDVVDLALWEQEADQEESLMHLRGKVDRFPSAGGEPAPVDIQAAATDASHVAIDARRQLARPRAEFLAATTALFEHGLGAVSAYVAATQRFVDALHDCGLSFIRARMLWNDLARDFQNRKPDAAIPDAVGYVINELGQYADEMIGQWRVLQREQVALASVPRMHK